MAPMIPLVVTGELGLNAVLVHSGQRRGIQYAVWRDPFPAARHPKYSQKLQKTGRVYAAVVYSPYVSADGTKGTEAEQIGWSRTVEGAIAHADHYIEKSWKFDMFPPRRHRRRHMSYEPNPISKMDWVVGGVALASIAGIIYYATRPSTASSSTAIQPPAGGGPVLLTLNAATPSVSVVDTAGVTLSLPLGANWGMVGDSTVNNNAPITINAIPAGQAAPVGATPYPWFDATNTQHSTNVTLTLS